MYHRRISLCVVALSVLASSAMAQSAAPDRIDILAKHLPRVATLPLEEFTIERITKATAPILWPSPSEIFEPQALPIRDSTDASKFVAGQPAYDYAVRLLGLPRPPDGQWPSLQSEEKVSLDPRITQIRIRYFFYFSGESGEIAHT